MAGPSSLNYSLRPFLVQPKRFYGLSVKWTPKLKEMLDPPPPLSVRRKPKGPLPSLKDIKIPERIERGPTDILKALASTVGRDYTAPHYKFHDDPYLIPYSNMSKRSYALSKEAGRKAAKWVREQHADLFQHRVAEPPVEAFYPSPVFTEESDLTEADLNKYAEQGLVQESIQIYNLLKSKGKEMSTETKQAFLELICFVNETEQIEDDMVEERWYKAGMAMRDRLKNTWKQGGIADNLFQEFENPSIQTYCCMIRGRAKFYQAERAWHMFTEVQSKGMVVDTETYNSLIRIANFLKESSELRWALVEDLLVDMKDNNVNPNLGTLNAILETVSMIGNHKEAKRIALATLAEFKSIDIEPSLASYCHILHLFCQDRGPLSSILVDILKMIDGKEFTIQDPKDTQFFVKAMDVARNHIQNVEIAHKIDDLLHTGNNYDLIGDSFRESIYYRHYVALRCNSEPFEDFMKFYNKVVPNIYTPEPGITEEILKSLEINTAITYLPQLWSDMIIFDQANRENLIALVLHIMAIYYPTNLEGLGIQQPEKLAAEFTEIGWKIWNIIEQQDRERMKQIGWTGKMLGDLLTLQVCGDQFENACEIIKKLVSPTASADVVGVTTLDSLKLFLDAAILNNNGAICLACLHYINECGFPEIRELAEMVHSKAKFDSIQTAKLNSIIGYDISTHKNDTGGQNNEQNA